MDLSCKTKPIFAQTARAEGRQAGPGLGRDPSRETKPICPHEHKRRPSGQLCETKPIGRSRSPEGTGGQGRPCSRRWGRAYKTKPICQERAGMGGGRQSCPCRRRGTKACKTKPIPARAARRASTLWIKTYGGLNMQWTSKKQSQFPAEPGARGLRDAGRGACTNKPNLAEAYCAKQSQSAPDGPEEALGRGRKGGHRRG